LLQANDLSVPQVVDVCKLRVKSHARCSDLPFVSALNDNDITGIDEALRNNLEAVDVGYDTLKDALGNRVGSYVRASVSI